MDLSDDAGPFTPSPLLVARGYQQEMLDESLHRNIIIALDTGSGKTHIAVLRLKHEMEKETDKVRSLTVLTVLQFISIISCLGSLRLLSRYVLSNLAYSRAIYLSPLVLFLAPTNLLNGSPVRYGSGSFRPTVSWFPLRKYYSMLFDMGTSF